MLKFQEFNLAIFQVAVEFLKRKIWCWKQKFNFHHKPNVAVAMEFLNYKKWRLPVEFLGLNFPGNKLLTITTFTNVT